tara:strand:+ start:174 stop:695 length:522 start_codon:yes stop_codon:yes gene_type:complete
MNRYQFEDLISDYVENKLTFSKRKDVEKYLKENPKDVSKLNQVRENICFLQSLPKTKVSTDFDRKLKDRIKKESIKPPKKRIFTDKSIFGFKPINFSFFTFLICFSVFLSYQFIDELFLPKDRSKRVFTNNDIEVKKTPKMLNKRKITVPSDTIKIDQNNNKNYSKSIKLVND